MLRRFSMFLLVLTLLVVSSLPSRTTAQGSDSEPTRDPVQVGALPSAITPDSEIGLDGRPFPAGGIRSGNQVIYDGGDVILEFAPAADVVILGSRCPAGWYCFFEDVDWRGRMLQFRSCCSTQFLSDWGFTDAASSWDNNLPTNDVNVYDRNGALLWCASQLSQSTWVGGAQNDKAHRFRIFNSTGLC